MSSLRSHLLAAALLGRAVFAAESLSPAAKVARPLALSPAESQALFEVPAGYRLELVVSEPLIAEPVVTVFDANGRMFVAEMRTYMQDIDGSNEKTPDSRVSMHWSSKNDGVYDRHSVFLDHLVLPRLILPLRDSLLVQETDTGDIFEYRDTDGDGVSDQKKLFYSGEARRSNLEHQTSGLIWCADNWLYSTYNSYRIRWTPSGIRRESTAPNGGQWGLTQDDWGKPWIVNAGGELGPINFQQPILYGAFRARGEVTPDFKEVWPLVPIPDVQGGPHRFRPEAQTLNHFTATCGADIYRGDRLPADLRGDLLFCEPVGRLVRRAKIEVRDGLTYLKNAYAQTEFIRSRDPYFRPVSLVTAPDGALYVTDMYRGIIQEGNWTKPGTYLRGVVQQYGLDRTIGHGRIWRLVHEGTKPAPAPRMLEETPAAWVAHLAHPNGWWRDTAQRLLVLAQEKSVIPALEAMARTHPDPLARFHALWTLEGLGAASPQLLREKLQDADVHVRVAAIRVSETLFKDGDLTLKPDIIGCFTAAAPEVGIQAMMTANLLKWPEAKALIQKVTATSPSRGVKEIGAQLLNPAAGRLPAGYQGDDLAVLEKGQEIYFELCFACHGLDGRGAPMDGKAGTLAPPLAGSATVTGHRDAMLNAVIFGVSGPVHGVTYDAPMAAMGANDNEWIAAVVSYVRTGFGNRGTLVSTDDVARIRTAAGGRTEPWTTAEIVQHSPQPVANPGGWRWTTSQKGKAGKAGTKGALKPPMVFGAEYAGEAWVQIELPETVPLAGLRFDSSKAVRAYPRSFQIQLSLDGERWSAPVASGKPSVPATEVSFTATPARFVRIAQAPRTPNAWTIDNVVLFQAPAVSAMSAQPPATRAP
jgi:mono/diheme cytochrome c family protein/glucose/arabinose dehydrogenase